MIENREKDDSHRRLYELSFSKRPAMELYDLASDPGQLTNVATDKKYSAVFQQLSKQLENQLRETGDPRIVGGAEKFDKFPYFGRGPRYPGSKKK